MRSGLPSTARTPLIVHLTLRARHEIVGFAPAGMFMLIGKFRLSPFTKCVGPASEGFILAFQFVASSLFLKAL